MIFVAITNPRYKLIMALSAVLVIFLLIWALGGNNVDSEVNNNNVPVIEENNELPNMNLQTEKTEEEKQGLIEKLKRYYQGE